jgi:ABC-2 type transport system permease protein
MNKTLLIFRHEFGHTIRRTGFIVLALALPILGLLGIGVSQVASRVSSPPAEVSKIGYVDQTGGFDQFTTQGDLNLVRYGSPEAATRALLDKDVTEYFVIPPDFLTSGVIQRYTAQREIAPPSNTASAIKNFISSNLLTGKVPPNVITWIEGPLNLVTTTLSATGEVAPQQGGLGSFIIPGIFSLLLALSIIISSTYVLQGLSEEKENRMMEILLSSVSTRQLLTGKVLGLGSAGLVQILLWVITLPLLLNLASSSIGGLIGTIQVPVYFWVLGIIYFILGYALFAVLAASISAVSSTVREAQSLAGIYTMFSVAPFWFISLLLFFPNSPVWVVFSIFPFSAPVMVLLRLGVTGVPVWQLVASIGVMALSVVGGLLLAAKLLRTYVLLYGKRPNLREIARAVRG